MHPLSTYLFIDSSSLLLQPSELLLQLASEYTISALFVAVILAGAGIFAYYTGKKKLSLAAITASMFLAYGLQQAKVFDYPFDQHITIVSYDLGNDKVSADYVLSHLESTQADLISIAGMPQDQLPNFQNQLVANGYCFPQISASPEHHTYEALFSKYPAYHNKATLNDWVSMVEVPWKNQIETIHFYGLSSGASVPPSNAVAWFRPTTASLQDSPRPYFSHLSYQNTAISLRHSSHFDCLSFQVIHNQEQTPIGFIGKYELLDTPEYGLTQQNTEL